MFHLESNRLIIREWENKDLKPHFLMNSNPKVMEFFPSILNKKESDQLAKKFIEAFEKSKLGIWPVILKKTNTFIGFAGLLNASFKAFFTPAVELGFRFFQEYWGKGFAIEASILCLEYGFNTMNLNEIVSFTSIRNQRSISLMRRLGMKTDPKENFFHPKLPKGHPLSEHVLYRLSQNDYSSIFLDAN